MGRDCACHADGPGALHSSMQEARDCSLDTAALALSDLLRDSGTKVPATSCGEVLGTRGSVGTRSQVKAVGASGRLAIVTFVQLE